MVVVIQEQPLFIVTLVLLKISVIYSQNIHKKKPTLIISNIFVDIIRITYAHK